MKFIHFVIIIIGFLFYCINLSAQQVSPSIAEQVAENFMSSLMNDVSYIQSRNPSTITNNQPYLDTTIVIRRRDQQLPIMYLVFKNGIWVLVAADNRITPILAYSDYMHGVNYSEDSIPPAAHDLLDWYEKQITYVQDSANYLSADTTWNKYMLAPIASSQSVVVEALLQRDGMWIHWQQQGNAERYLLPTESNCYNKFCPAGDTCAHSIVGCVAVAMGQLMWYWMWPHAILTEANNTTFIREYDWNMMPPMLFNSTPLHCVDMVAHLLHDAGESVNMLYGCGESLASSSEVPSALQDVFGYAADNLRPRNLYIAATWLSLLKNELNNGRPIYYSGRTPNTTAGHAFVIDGYDSSNHFHMNFGFHPATFANGYFLLDSIAPSSSNQFEYTFNQTAVLGIQPNYPDCSPMSISSPLTWSTSKFIVQNGGGITIENRIVVSNQKGVIYSGDYIRLTNGVHIQSGANVHLAIKDMKCGTNNPAPNNLPSRNLNTNPSDNSSSPKKVTSELLQIVYNPTNKMIRILNGEEISAINVYSISGQLVQTCSRPNMDISFLSSGVYIVTAQTSTGEKVQEKIAVY